MCGLAGLLDAGGGHPHGELHATALAMADAVAHRGPDSAGAWVDETAGLALGHRRLAILDLSDAGSQPMVSVDGRYVLAYNGELYDHRDVRADLEARGSVFRGRSDTEVLLEAIRVDGLVPTLRRVDGMFALALWDRAERRLVLARDKMGEKPLYYGRAGRAFVFGSELRSLRAHADFRSEVDPASLALLLRLSYIPAPWTAYRGVAKLPAGTLLRVQPDGLYGEPEAYWTLREVAEAGRADPWAGTEAEAVDELERLLRQSVRRRLESDVPLGVFLSGGVDSTTIAALAQAESTRRLRTYTVSLGGGTADEGPAARAVAAHLGTDHSEAVLTHGDGLELVPRLPELYDEPFADPSQIPTALICAEARRHVTVCLSGDGGDEVFAGYNRYVHGRALWQRSQKLPVGLRRSLATTTVRVPPGRVDAVATRLPGLRRQHGIGTKLHKAAGLLGAADERELYRRLVSNWRDPAAVLPGTVEHRSAATSRSWLPDGDVVLKMAYLDGVSTLPDEMLVKVDRASMATSLEVRVPLIAPDVVAFAWRLPLDMLVRGGRGKWALRQVLDRHVPAQLVDRPKLGFDPPLAAWLRGPLRPWAEDLLSPERLRAQGLFDAAAARAIWEEHLSGRRNHDYALWALLVAQQWLLQHEREGVL